ncbi:MAG: hypothetical protein M3308_02730 [Actinomycetota bacterium]|nr:hypothetical protein [Actinomycetota bacterium]
MTNTSIASIQPTTRFMWRLGAASGAVSTGATILLIPLAERTADFFAWTIAVPASAAFIGLFYLTLTVMALLGLRQPWWAPARAALVPAVVFVALVLVTTLLHLDKFHLFSGGLLARTVAWIWFVIYVVTVPVYLFGFWWQRRAPGGDPPRTFPLSPWVRVALGGLAVVLTLEGVALFVAPPLGESLWPWALTPLTARMIGVTLISVALLAGAIIRIDDRVTGRIPAIGVLTFGVTALAVVARYSGQVQWSRPSAWAYIAVMLALAVAALVALSRAGSARPSAIPTS